MTTPSAAAETIEPSDFLEFWTRTLDDEGASPLSFSAIPADVGLASIEVYDVTFAGFGGHRIRAWLMIPSQREEPLPGIVEFVGYGGGRGHPLQHTMWASAGFAHLIMDTRGQGATWGGGATSDPVGSGPSVAGFLTRGIESPATYYYRRVFIDAIRAVRSLRTVEMVDPGRVSVLGGSQGGGIALAVTALDHEVATAVVHVPFLSGIRAAVRSSESEPYQELTRYLKTNPDRIEETLATVDYFDGLNFARHSVAPAYFSVGLLDEICPPEAVISAFEAYAGPKTLAVREFGGHEVHTLDVSRSLAFIRDNGARDLGDTQGAS